jgi:hypothetical protein
MIQVNPVREKVEVKVEEENTLVNGKLRFMVGSNFFFRFGIKSGSR